MTADQLKLLRDHELIAMQLINDGEDLFLAGRCVFSESQTPYFYTTHPLAPMTQWLTIQDQPGAFVFHRTGKIFTEALQDKEFANYYRFAEHNLDLPDDKENSWKYVAVTVALTFEQASIQADLRPEWFSAPHQIPLNKIDDVHSLMTRMDECLRLFCEQYKEDVPVPGRLH